MGEPARPIFVIGAPRSGVSHLTWSLGQHPHILPLIDSRWLDDFSRGLHEAYATGVAHRARSQLDVMGIEIEDFCERFGRTVDDLFLEPKAGRPGEDGDAHGDAAAHGSPPRFSVTPRRPKRWVDGSPDHCFNVFGLLRLFPEARFIHVLRDADEVVAALNDPAKQEIYRSHFQPMAEEDAYERWIATVTACVEAERAFGSETVMRVLRQDMVRDPEGTLRRCLSFLDEPFSDACLRPFR